jgi:hypothetical protein
MPLSNFVSSGSSADEVWALIKLAFLVCSCLRSGHSGLRCGEGPVPGPQRESHHGLTPSAQPVQPSAVGPSPPSHGDLITAASPSHGTAPGLPSRREAIAPVGLHRPLAGVGKLSYPAHLGRLGRKRSIQRVTTRADPAPNAKRLALRPPMRCLGKHTASLGMADTAGCGPHRGCGRAFDTQGMQTTCVAAKHRGCVEVRHKQASELV